MPSVLTGNIGAAGPASPANNFGGSAARPAPNYERGVQGLQAKGFTYVPGKGWRPPAGMSVGKPPAPRPQVPTQTATVDAPVPTRLFRNPREVAMYQANVAKYGPQGVANNMTHGGRKPDAVFPNATMSVQTQVPKPPPALAKAGSVLTRYLNSMSAAGVAPSFAAVHTKDAGDTEWLGPLVDGGEFVKAGMSSFADGFFRNLYEKGIAFDDLPALVKKAGAFAPEGAVELEEGLRLIKEAGAWGRLLSGAASLGTRAASKAAPAIRGVQTAASRAGSIARGAASGTREIAGELAPAVSDVVAGAKNMAGRASSAVTSTAGKASPVLAPVARVGGGALIGGTVAPEGHGLEGAVLGAAMGGARSLSGVQRLAAGGGTWGGRAGRAVNFVDRAAKGSLTGMGLGFIGDQAAGTVGIDTDGAGMRWGSRLGLIPGAAAAATPKFLASPINMALASTAAVPAPAVGDLARQEGRGWLSEQGAKIVNPIYNGYKARLESEAPDMVAGIINSPKVTGALREQVRGVVDEALGQAQTRIQEIAKSPETQEALAEAGAKAVSNPKFGQALMAQGKQMFSQFIKDSGLGGAMDFFKSIGGGIDKVLGMFMSPDTLARMSPFMKLALVLGGGMTLGGGLMGSPLTAGLGAAMLGGGLYGSGALDGLGGRLSGMAGSFKNLFGGGAAPAQSITDSAPKAVPAAA